ncbi:MAG: hypothetical protein V7K48_08735, partial [Nostoc sp.]|uniref:hypothetical protein n=1 Tax=Nostoc sp. TaxID=1180 RepID=UPI002FF7A07F
MSGVDIQSCIKRDGVSQWEIYPIVKAGSLQKLQQFDIKTATKVINLKDVKKKIIKKWQHIQST